jgi:hypothetical protein
MRAGELLLVDEISLAEDAVLERLNRFVILLLFFVHQFSASPFAPVVSAVCWSRSALCFWPKRAVVSWM